MSLNPREVFDKVFGPPIDQCSKRGPKHLVCELEVGHEGTHQMMGINGFWHAWRDNDRPERQTLYGQEEHLEAEEDPAGSQGYDDDSSLWW